jgi:hypothetical protein
LIDVAIFLDTSSWTWIAVVVFLLAGGFFFLNKLMSKGIYEESTEGRSRLSGAFSEMQSLVDPAHRHILEERERKRAEHDDAGDDPEQSDSGQSQ